MRGIEAAKEDWIDACSERCWKWGKHLVPPPVWGLGVVVWVGGVDWLGELMTKLDAGALNPGTGDQEA